MKCLKRCRYWSKEDGNCGAFVCSPVCESLPCEGFGLYYVQFYDGEYKEVHRDAVVGAIGERRLKEMLRKLETNEKDIILYEYYRNVFYGVSRTLLFECAERVVAR